MNVFTLLARGAPRPSRWRRKNYVGIVGILATGAVVAAGLAVASGPAGAVNVPNWYQVTPTASPPPVRDASMAYDSALGKIVQFGGEINAGTYLKTNQTWTYDGTTWTNATPDPVTEANNPMARAGASMVYDAALGKIVLFGGRAEVAGGYSNDTWTYDGTTWTQVTANAAEGSPPGRQEAMMAYDANIGKVVLFGGINTSGARLDDTWTFDGTTWTYVSSTTRPSARTGGAMAYDPGTSSVILFGGSAVGSYLADTWSWSAGTWTQLAPGTGPAARCYSQLVYDADAGVLMLYGGYNNAGLSDTWTFDATANSGAGAWTQVTPATNPGARLLFGMAFDAATHQVVLFGGWSYGGQVLLGDTWAYGIPPVNPPDAPAAPVAVPGNGRVTVSWTAPYDGNAPIESYDVAWKQSTSATWPSASTTNVLAPTTTAPVTGLTNGTSYDFRVRAVNSQGAGDWSPIASATPSSVPGVPAAPSVTPGNGQALISWAAPTDGGSPITGYTVAYLAAGSHKWLTVSSADTSETVTGLTNNVQYSFKVLATNANGSSAYSLETPGTPFAAGAPDPPTGLAGVPTVTGRSMDVALTWTDGGNTSTDHEVVVYSYRMSNKGVATYREIDRFLTGSGDSTAQVTGLSASKLYAFTVAAGNTAGWSLPSEYYGPVGG